MYSIYSHELNHVQQAGAGATWPMLPVETEVNGDSKSTNERGPFFVGLSCQYKRILSMPWLLLAGGRAGSPVS
jgi:hypothetical protein